MPRNENAYLSRAWLGLLPLPLDQALRAPLQKYKSRVISRKWGNVIKTVKIVERGRKIDEEKKKRERLEREKEGSRPTLPSFFPFFLPRNLPPTIWTPGTGYVTDTILYNAFDYLWTGPCKIYWGLLKLHFWWVKWQVLVIRKISQFSGAYRLLNEYIF